MPRFAAWTVASGGFGATLGLLAAGAFSIGRGVMPEFGGEEWLSQFLKLGLACGAVIWLLAAGVLADVWVCRELWFPRWPSATAARMVRRYAMRQSLVLLLFGGLFGVVVLYASRYAGLAAMACMVFVGRVVYAVLHRGRPLHGSADRWDRFHSQALFFLLPVLPLAALVVVIASLVSIVGSRGQDWSNHEILLLIVGLSAGLALLHAVVIVAAHGERGLRWAGIRPTLVIAGGVAAIVATSLAPELMRAAALGNLQQACLVVEPVVARHIERWLMPAEHSSPCSMPTAPELRVIEVDVVSRLGAQYTLAASGRLEAQPNGRCAPLHRTGVRVAQPGVQAPASARGQQLFPCIDIPRDAVKLVLR
ncbi:hypothetical protein V4F39_05285 [Aquincola sp. MAHUQ-54]|uniref:Uncharacterized protein n=1 Tax=Aquincola agrisoli TaxID=3119538 RepID=A0AAW9QD07_9BURK